MHSANTRMTTGTRRHVAIEIILRPYYLRSDTDVRDRWRITMAKAAGFLFVHKMRFDGLQSLQGPMRKPAITRRLVNIQLLF